MSQDSTRDQLIKGGLIVVVITLLSTPLGYFIRLLLSRTLSIEMYGLLYAGLNFIGIFATYNDLGFGYALSFLLPKYVKKKEYATSWTLYTYEKYVEVSTALILSLAIIWSSDWLATYYFKVPEAKWVLILLCLYFVVNSYLSGLQKFFVGLRLEIFHTSIQPLTLILTFSWAYLFWIFKLNSVYTYVLSWALSYGMVSLIFTFLNHRLNGRYIRQTVSWQPNLFKRMLKYAVPTLVTSSIFTFITFIDTFFLTLFHGVSQVGIYNIIIPIVTLPAILFTPLDNFLFPYISHFAEDEKDKIVVLMNSTQKLIVIIALYTGLFIALFPTAIVSVLFGNQWLGHTELPLRLYASGFVIFALASHFNTIISGIGRVNDRLQVSFFIAAANLVLGGVLIYYFSVLGAVVANLLIHTLSLVLYATIIKKEISFKFPWFFFVRALVLVGVLVGVSQWSNWQPQGLVAFLMTGVGYTLSFGVLVLVLKLYEIDSLLVTQLKHKFKFSSPDA
jgi:O-antigen/teichoic acid export membrane protein